MSKLKPREVNGLSRVTQKVGGEAKLESTSAPTARSAPGPSSNEELSVGERCSSFPSLPSRTALYPNPQLLKQALEIGGIAGGGVG